MAGETILIVEDSPVSLKLTASALRADGYKVQLASTAEQALSTLRSLKPDLILVDLILPGMNGLELTRQIRQDKRLHDVTVVALTACNMEGDEERARSAGCDGYLLKPFDKQTLEEVRQFLDFGGDVSSSPEAGETLTARRGEAAQPITLAIPESELEDLRRTFLADGVVQSRQLLAALDEGFDKKRTTLLSHWWAGTGGLLGFPKISDRAREVEVVLQTQPWTGARMRVAMTNLAHAFAEPAAAAAELQIPDSIAHALNGKRVALVGLGDVEAERMCAALEHIGAKPRLFEADDPPHSEAVRECSVALIHVRPETMEAKWLAPEFVPPPRLPLVFIGARERLFALHSDVQARAREFLIDGWQPEEALMRLSFALSRMAAAEPAASQAPAEPQRRTVTGPAEVLVADDDITLRTLVRSTLLNRGMQCRVAANGPEALEEIRTHRPHAAVLDVNMPGMDGFEVLATIRAENIPVRVILLTARQQEQDVLRGFSLGADDYIVKPFSPMELVARLKRLLLA
jgi:CheY-like chemotaxis protein